MADVRVRLKIGGVRAILRGPEATAEVAKRVKRGAAVAGPGFDGVVKPHKYTARGYVQTATQEGRKREANEKVLLRALDAMR